jgi:hypothetical protein
MNDLKNRVSDYIAGEISLEEFEDWFVPTYWNVLTGKEEELSQMVYDIELRLAEYSRGNWTEHELKEHLNSLLSWNGWVKKPQKEEMK